MLYDELKDVLHALAYACTRAHTHTHTHTHTNHASHTHHAPHIHSFLKSFFKEFFITICTKKETTLGNNESNQDEVVDRLVHLCDTQMSRTNS